MLRIFNALTIEIVVCVTTILAIGRNTLYIGCRVVVEHERHFGSGRQITHFEIGAVYGEVGYGSLGFAEHATLHHIHRSGGRGGNGGGIDRHTCHDVVCDGVGLIVSLADGVIEVGGSGFLVEHFQEHARTGGNVAVIVCHAALFVDASHLDVVGARAVVTTADFDG